MEVCNVGEFSYHDGAGRRGGNPAKKVQERRKKHH